MTYSQSDVCNSVMGYHFKSAYIAMSCILQKFAKWLLVLMLLSCPGCILPGSYMYIYVYTEGNGIIYLALLVTFSKTEVFFHDNHCD